MSEEFNDNETFKVNYHVVVNSKDLMTETRQLARSLMENPYLSIGDYLKNISDHSLEKFIDMINEGEEGENFQEFLLIAEMLARAEGLDEGTLDVITERTNILCTMICCESLYRKGMIKLHHNNMSFGEDMRSAVIAERI